MSHGSSSTGIPVTLLSGFLGSGKTTLLNYILQANHGKRIAVIENEFGEIGIDHDLVIGVDEDIFEMSNGCICCSIKGDLVETLNRLLDRKDKFDSILIESTGLASPGPIAQAFLVEETVQHGLYLDGIITLVDARHIEQQLVDADVAWEQIAFSHVILINKIDLVTKEELKAVEERVRQINPAAGVLISEHAQTDLDRIMNIGGFELHSGLEDLLQEHDHHDHELGNDAYSAQGIQSVSITDSGTLDINRFNIWLQTLLIVEGMDVFRAKGVLNLPDTDQRYIFQSVYMMFDGEHDRPWGDSERQNRIVFIGRNLDSEKLKQGFQNCLLEPDSH